jgi:nicotinate-nucleotide--dimethylbenzimidazole phosphoribosyltransferase
VALHAGATPLEALHCPRGREIAAMAGATACARVRRIPVILDGFICCAAAAAVLHAEVPGALKRPMGGRFWRWACGWAKGMAQCRP